MAKHREIRKINSNLGFHELAKAPNNLSEDRSFAFQLQYMAEQSEDILQHFDRLAQNTYNAAPRRDGAYRLHRGPGSRLPALEESKWEEAMYRRWSVTSGLGTSLYLPVCPHIQTYQFPLKYSHGDKSWGEIDLLGVSPEFLPVPNELKKRASSDSPLRMLIEVAAYGFALHEVWPLLRADWEQCMERRFGHCPEMPVDLDDKIRLIGVAPAEYWDACLGCNPKSRARRVPAQAWAPFWQLVDKLADFFDVHFAVVHGTWEGNDRLPAVSGATLLDLRERTS